jgi:hypothetical protein
MTRNKNHELQVLGYLLNRWGRHLETLRLWHGYPTIEAVYRAFFGPGGYDSLRIPIPDTSADIIRLNLRILALRPREQDVLFVFYGCSTKPEGGYFSEAEKARMLSAHWKTRVTEREIQARIHIVKKQLLNSFRLGYSSVSIPFAA